MTKETDPFRATMSIPTRQETQRKKNIFIKRVVCSVQPGFSFISLAPDPNIETVVVFMSRLSTAAPLVAKGVNLCSYLLF